MHDAGEYVAAAFQRGGRGYVVKSRLTRARPLGQIAPPGAGANDPLSLQQLGMSLFQDYLLPFEVTSILLLVAMVGAIVLIRKERRVH